MFSFVKNKELLLALQIDCIITHIILQFEWRYLPYQLRYYAFENKWQNFFFFCEFNLVPKTITLLIKRTILKLQKKKKKRRFRLKNFLGNFSTFNFSHSHFSLEIFSIARLYFIFVYHNSMLWIFNHFWITLQFL